MSGGYIDCACCGQTEMVSHDREVLCDDCVQAGCEAQEGGENAGYYCDCQVPQCPDCETRSTYCTSDNWVDNCDDDCPRFMRDGRTSWHEDRKPRRAPPMQFRVPLAWLRASRWDEKIRPHVLSYHYPSPGLVYDRIEVLPKLCRYGDGGYPLYYIATTPAHYSHNGDAQSAVCAVCATDVHEWGDEDTRITDIGVNWEDPEFYCEECSERIESAYADEDEDEEKESVLS